MFQFFALIVFYVFFFVSLFSEEEVTKDPIVIVSISPYAYFVKAIAQESVKIVTLVPSGTSFHHYEPTPKQVLEACQADIWFQIGETFEQRADRALHNCNSSLKIVDLRKGVDLINEEGCAHCLQKGADLHIWLSLRQAKTQAKAIAQALIERYPLHAQEYQARLQLFLKTCDDLDAEILDLLKPLSNRTILVSHAAYAYFARDYSLIQLPIEYEGKDPSPKQLHTLLNRARELHIDKIYVQPQHSIKGAQMLAKTLNARLITLDPYSADYIETLRNIAYNIADTPCQKKTQLK
jgi:zinc transport system substrate-binding protein